MEKNLVDEHFEKYNTLDHICYPTFKRLFQEIEKRGNPPLIIVETGTAAHGTKSTFLFDKYVQRYGGHLWSVDINPEASKEASLVVSSEHTTLITQDSVQFLYDFVNVYPSLKIDLLYLDSWDIDFNKPLPAGNHGYNEFCAIQPLIGYNSLVLIDDTPRATYNISDKELNYYKMTRKMPGKGMFVVDRYPQNIIMHEYQALFKF